MIHEAALRTQVGGQGVMQHQLLQLPQVGVLRNVSIQVLPFGVEESAAFIRKVAEEL
ncbi:Scr1 family TA system antitoxin-like transcriptional regulator [Streptomyces mirabilis]